MAAVKHNGMALQYAAEECKRDHEIVIAAVQQNGHALDYASEECKADHGIVLAAVQQCGMALGFAADELLLDSTFAPEAKQDWYILKVSMLSGRSTVVLQDDNHGLSIFIEDIVRRCCKRLGIERSGTEKLVHGIAVVPATVRVDSWPGLQPAGEVSEYQLIL
eukprot:4844316-Amphidinium_carterae.1